MLGARTSAVLRLRQLLDSSWVHVVDLTTCANYSTSCALLRSYDGLCLSLCLGLGGLQGKSSDLVHESSQVLIPARRDDLCTYLLQSALGQISLHHRRLTYNLCGSDTLGMVQVSHLSGHLSIASLTVRLMLTLCLQLSLSVCRGL